MESKPVFNNVHNKPHETKDGSVIWDSRSVAVVSHVWMLHNNIAYILVGKRGPKSEDPGKYNLPCGYMDKNEDFRGAVLRETWEETGFYIDGMKARRYYEALEQPWFVYTDPKENRQNVVLHGGIVFQLDLPGMELPKLSLDNMEDGESDGAYWMTLKEVEAIPAEEWAYNHDTRLKQFGKEWMKFRFSKD